MRIGSGAGFAGDRLEPAVILVEQGGIDYLGLECLAERTIALGQLRRRSDPEGAYDPLLERRMEMLLPLLRRKGVRLISNVGAANPRAAGERIVRIAQRLRVPVKVARATVVGHLLECAAQVSGGYFADPGRKEVDDLAHVGFPYADVAIRCWSSA